MLEIVVLVLELVNLLNLVTDCMLSVARRFSVGMCAAYVANRISAKCSVEQTVPSEKAIRDIGYVSTTESSTNALLNGKRLLRANVTLQTASTHVV